MVDEDCRTVFILGNAHSIHVQRWTNHFSKIGWSVHLLTYTPTQRKQLDNRVTQHRLFRIRLLESFLEPLNRKIRVKQIKNLIVEIRPNLVHAHDLAKYGEYAYLSAFKPYILTNWGLSDLKYIQNYLLFFNKPLKGRRRILRQNAFENAYAITCLVDEAKKAIIELFNIDPDKIHSFPWGVDTALFYRGYNEEVMRLRKELGIPKDAKVVVSSRYLSKFYNIEVIIKACAIAMRDNNIHLVIKGSGGSKRYESRLKALTDSLGIRERCHFINKQVHYREMPIYFNLADVSVMIPRTDQGALSVYESMICGAVIIATDCPGNQEMIKDGENGYLVNPTDINTLSAMITLALKDGIREKFYRVNRDWILQHADWKKNSKRMEQIYFSAIQKGK